MKFRVVKVEPSIFTGEVWVTVQFEDGRMLEVPVKEGQNIVEAVKSWVEWKERKRERTEKARIYAEKFIGQEFEIPDNVKVATND